MNFFRAPILGQVATGGFGALGSPNRRAGYVAGFVAGRGAGRCCIAGESEGDVGAVDEGDGVITRATGMMRSQRWEVGSLDDGIGGECITVR